MFEKLQERWKVKGLDLLLIITTFALGGSLCGWLGRKILLFSGMEKGFLWLVLYILLITLLWPICVILVSLPLGQFKFFISYLKRIWSKMSGKQKSLPVIAIFASGAGSNAKNIIHYFNQPEKKSIARIGLIVSNKQDAGVLKIAQTHGIPTLIINKDQFLYGNGYTVELKNHGIQVIILAGFLLKVPQVLLNEFSHRIINIHPALLPAYGGKGMYGHHVHAAVIQNKETKSGISIHEVDEQYDHGTLLFQKTCDVSPDDNPETLAQKIHQLEHAHYPQVIESWIEKQNLR